MYKLLPPETREKVKSEYLIRRAVVIALALILMEIITVVGLLPSYVLSRARYEEVSERAKIISTKAEGGEDLSLWLTSLNTKLKILAPKLDADKPAEDLREVIRVKGSGVVLTGFSWAKLEGKNGITVAGVAKDRQSLLSFEGRLKDLKKFTEVTFPISNLAKDKDISFEVKLTFNKP